MHTYTKAVDFGLSTSSDEHVVTAYHRTAGFQANPRLMQNQVWVLQVNGKKQPMHKIWLASAGNITIWSARAGNITELLLLCFLFSLHPLAKTLCLLASLLGGSTCK